MGPSNVENFSPQIIKQICKELLELTQNPMEGIRVVYNDNDITNVQADIDGPPGTPYCGGSFRIRLVLGKSFPSTPPKGFFITKIFHPNVGRNGEICVNTLKKDWKKDLESALNEEAGMMLLSQYDDYCRRAKMLTEIHAAKVIEKTVGDVDTKPGSSKSSSSMANNNNDDHGNDGIHLNELEISPKQQGQKHPLEECLSDEPVSKKINNILNSNSSSGDHQQRQQEVPPQPKITGMTAGNKNRGLKRVLRLRS